MSRVQLPRCTRVERHNRLLTDSTKAEAGCWPAKPAVPQASARGRRARQAQKHSAPARIPARRKAGALWRDRQHVSVHDRRCKGRYRCARADVGRPSALPLSQAGAPRPDDREGLRSLLAVSWHELSRARAARTCRFPVVMCRLTLTRSRRNRDTTASATGACSKPKLESLIHAFDGTRSDIMSDDQSSRTTRSRR